jgi:hypothetical protein
MLFRIFERMIRSEQQDPMINSGMGVWPNQANKPQSQAFAILLGKGGPCPFRLLSWNGRQSAMFFTMWGNPAGECSQPRERRAKTLRDSDVAAWFKPMQLLQSCQKVIYSCTSHLYISPFCLNSIQTGFLCLNSKNLNNTTTIFWLHDQCLSVLLCHLFLPNTLCAFSLTSSQATLLAHLLTPSSPGQGISPPFNSSLSSSLPLPSSWFFHNLVPQNLATNDRLVALVSYVDLISSAKF